MMNSEVELRRLHESEWDEVATLIFDSTNSWYQKNFSKNVFNGQPSAARVFPEVYEMMDPGCCIIAESGGRMAGSCFVHPRETHFSLGIMNVHPKFYGRGIAGVILREIIAMAEAESKPVRLVSSAMNLDSFSLYTRHGFVPRATYQDMFLPVPEDGLAAEAYESALTNYPATYSCNYPSTNFSRKSFFDPATNTSNDHSKFTSKLRNIWRRVKWIQCKLWYIL